MAGFFKRFKINAVTEKRLGSYLLYAVGEIILVVVGILIALQINNHNERNRQEVRLYTILKNVSYDLEMDTLMVSQAIAYYEDKEEIAAEILKDTYTADTYETCISCGNMLGTYFPLTLNDKGYTQLKSYYEASKEKDSLAIEIVQFYTAFNALVEEFTAQVKDNTFDNLKHWRDTQPWFYKVTSQQRDPRFFEYMTTLDYKNRVAFYDAIACKNLKGVLSGYKTNANEVLRRIELRLGED